MNCILNFAQSEKLEQLRGELPKYVSCQIQRKSHPIRILIEASAGPEDNRAKDSMGQSAAIRVGLASARKKTEMVF